MKKPNDPLEKKTTTQSAESKLAQDNAVKIAVEFKKEEFKNSLRKERPKEMLHAGKKERKTAQKNMPQRLTKNEKASLDKIGRDKYIQKQGENFGKKASAILTVGSFMKDALQDPTPKGIADTAISTGADLLKSELIDKFAGKLVGTGIKSSGLGTIIEGILEPNIANAGEDEIVKQLREEAQKREASSISDTSSKTKVNASSNLADRNPEPSNVQPASQVTILSEERQKTEIINHLQELGLTNDEANNVLNKAIEHEFELEEILEDTQGVVNALKAPNDEKYQLTIDDFMDSLEFAQNLGALIDCKPLIQISTVIKSGVIILKVQVS